MIDDYIPRKSIEHQSVKFRDLNHKVHCWGDPNAIPIILLHGWADTGMSFQFLADAMQDDWYLIAPDWRGFGDTDRSPAGYWFPDYLAHLDAFIDYYSQHTPVRLLGHSMGGNVACLYAGVRPEKISHLVSLDAFGLRDASSEQAPARYALWLDQCRQTQSFSTHENINSVATRLQRLAPRLSGQRSRFIAKYWSETSADGRRVFKIDPSHKRVNPVLYRRDEVRACWRLISARTLLVLGKESELFKRYYEEGGQQDCRSNFKNLSEVIIQNAGHMLHLDQPEKLALVLDDFFRQ